MDIRLNTRAVAMDHESVLVSGPEGEERIRTRTRIWAAGVRASPLAKQLADGAGAQVDRAGRVLVNPDCTLPGRPEVYAIGDMVSLDNLPRAVQPALQEGKDTDPGKMIRARLGGATSVKPFRYFYKGTMATIGHKSAVTEAFGLGFTGIHRVSDVGVHPQPVPDRPGQPAGHALHLDLRARLRGAPRAPAHHVRAGAHRNP